MRDNLEPPWVGIEAGKRLALVSVPSGRDVKARNSWVLQRIGIDLLGKIALECQVQEWICGGYACRERGGIGLDLEKIGIV